jgi:hypothetical protein
VLRAVGRSSILGFRPAAHHAITVEFPSLIAIELLNTY